MPINRISKIEKLINQLNKEINSVWYPNKDLKILKKQGLIQMLENSKQRGIYEVISDAMNRPGMLEGCTSRTHELLKDLQEENSRRLAPDLA